MTLIVKDLFFRRLYPFTLFLLQQSTVSVSKPKSRLIVKLQEALVALVFTSLRIVVAWHFADTTFGVAPLPTPPADEVVGG